MIIGFFFLDVNYVCVLYILQKWVDFTNPRFYLRIVNKTIFVYSTSSSAIWVCDSFCKKAGKIKKMLPYEMMILSFFCMNFCTWPTIGSRCTKIWKIGGGRVFWRTVSNCAGCPHTATALAKCSIPPSISPQASISSPSWT